MTIDMIIQCGHEMIYDLVTFTMEPFSNCRSTRIESLDDSKFIARDCMSMNVIYCEGTDVNAKL
jgi:hypothetical protein